MKILSNIILFLSITTLSASFVEALSLSELKDSAKFRINNTYKWMKNNPKKSLMAYGYGLFCVYEYVAMNNDHEYNKTPQYRKILGAIVLPAREIAYLANQLTEIVHKNSEKISKTILQVKEL